MKIESPEKILELEFEYIKGTANQAIDDRLKLLNFYIALSTSAGTASIAILSVSNSDNIQSFLAGIGLLGFIITLVGWIFLAMMIRLRQAWFESMVAMNTIKQFFDDNTELKLGEAFHWNFRSIPKPQRFWNIHFFATSLVNMISSLSLSLSIFAVTIKIVGAGEATGISAAVWVTSLVLLTFIYWVSLTKKL